jgi:hypothetical protein
MGWFEELHTGSNWLRNVKSDQEQIQIANEAQAAASRSEDIQQVKNILRALHGGDKHDQRLKIVRQLYESLPKEVSCERGVEMLRGQFCVFVDSFSVLHNKEYRSLAIYDLLNSLTQEYLSKEEKVAPSHWAAETLLALKDALCELEYEEAIAMPDKYGFKDVYWQDGGKLDAFKYSLRFLLKKMDPQWN